jgi:hypothetical protein
MWLVLIGTTNAIESRDERKGSAAPKMIPSVLVWMGFSPLLAAVI